MEESKENIKEINIFPTNIWKRILVVLADIALSLIASIFLFELVILPITKVAINYGEYVTVMDETYRNRDQILFDNGLLVNEKNKASGNIDEDIYDTSIAFLEFYVDSSLNNQVNAEYEVVFHYYSSLKNLSIDEINEIYSEKCGEYLDLEGKKTVLGTYPLKKSYLDMISPYYDETNELSQDGKDVFLEVQQNFFLRLFYNVLNEVIENDIKSPINSELESYNTYNEIVTEMGENLYIYYEIGAFVSFGVISIIFYLVIPMCNFKGRTISEMILKIERVEMKHFRYLSRPERIGQFCFNTINSGCLIFLIPVISMGIGEVFALNFTLPISLVCVVFLIAELIIMIINKFNRSLKEITSNSIVVDSSTMDEFYKIKGYDLD